MKQTGLGEFTKKPDISAKRSLTSPLRLRVLAHLSEGRYAAQIAQIEKVRRQTVSDCLKSLEKAGLVAKEGRGYPVFYSLTPAGKDVSLTTAGTVVAAPSLTSRSEGAIQKNEQERLWEVHYVRGIAGVRREGDWARVRQFLKPVVFRRKDSSKRLANEWLWYSKDATLRLRKHSVTVEVRGGLTGQTDRQVVDEANARAKVLLADFMREFGFSFNEFSWNEKSFHWVLDKELSKPFLKFMPSLADGSHPGQVEVHSEVEKNSITNLLDGGYDRRLDGVEVTLKALASSHERLISQVELITKILRSKK